MTHTNISNFQKYLQEYLNQAVVHNDVIHINTEDGNAVVMNAEDYAGLVETLRLLSNEKTAKEILVSMKEPLQDGTVYRPDEEW